MAQPRPTFEQLKELVSNPNFFDGITNDKIVYASDKSDTAFELEVEQLFIVNKDVDELIYTDDLYDLDYDEFEEEITKIKVLVLEGIVVGVNALTIDYNYGELAENHEVVENNYGIITDNFGRVENNNNGGEVTDNTGVINYNNNGGELINNNNGGVVESNYGKVINNNIGGTIYFSYSDGEVTNNDGGIVEQNIIKPTLVELKKLIPESETENFFINVLESNIVYTSDEIDVFFTLENEQLFVVNTNIDELKYKDGLSDEQKSKIKVIMLEGSTVKNSSLTINYNYGNVERNYDTGKVTNNYGKVYNDSVVTNNNNGGDVRNSNSGVVEKNNSGGVVDNDGKVTDNSGVIYNGTGAELINNNYGGEVKINKGVVSNNKDGAVVTNAYGEITNNYGLVTSNPFDGKVINNQGEVTDNYGVVESNYNNGLVTNNVGQVKNNNDGLITKNLGTITHNNGVVTNNHGLAYITNNNGKVTRNYDEAEVTNNNDGGVVTDNSGQVFNNFGKVINNNNHGKVFKNNSGGEVTNNYYGAAVFDNTLGGIVKNHIGGQVGSVILGPTLDVLKELIPETETEAFFDNVLESTIVYTSDKTDTAYTLENEQLFIVNTNIYELKYKDGLSDEQKSKIKVIVLEGITLQRNKLTINYNFGKLTENHNDGVVENNSGEVYLNLDGGVVINNNNGGVVVTNSFGGKVINNNGGIVEQNIIKPTLVELKKLIPETETENFFNNVLESNIFYASDQIEFFTLENEQLFVVNANTYELKYKDGLSDEQKSKIKVIVLERIKVVSNYLTINYNYGIVNRNYIKIINNYGNVDNAGVVINNNNGGQVTGNDGKVENNRGVVDLNFDNGEVTDNYGVINTNTNNAKVINNNNGGKVDDNGAVVTHNYGVININRGKVIFNDGVVSQNLSLAVVENNNSGGVVENNYGGGVVENNNGGQVTNNDVKIGFIEDEGGLLELDSSKILSLLKIGEIAYLDKNNDGDYTDDIDIQITDALKKSDFTQHDPINYSGDTYNYVVTIHKEDIQENYKNKIVNKNVSYDGKSSEKKDLLFLNLSDLKNLVYPAGSNPWED